ncbi:MAG: 4Fe-4S dicluster domain-containing protein [Planctomycetota bacterium]|jgi:Fe-S-cluster-containing dehydrogenase component
MTQKTASRTVVCDLARCLGCRSCELACAKAHAGFADIVAAVLAGARLVPRVRVIEAEGMAVPVQCQHCEDAPCASVCPSGALYVDEDTGVLHTAGGKCIGCKACIIACPFGAARYDRGSGTVFRCDLCEDIIEAGEEPKCVTACPTRARRIVDVDDLSEQRRKEAERRTVRVFRAGQGDAEE